MTWGSSEGNQRLFLERELLTISEHFFDICLVDPRCIQESSGTIFKHFRIFGDPRDVTWGGGGGGRGSGDVTDVSSFPF